MSRIFARNLFVELASLALLGGWLNPSFLTTPAFAAAPVRLDIELVRSEIGLGDAAAFRATLHNAGPNAIEYVVPRTGSSAGFLASFSGPPGVEAVTIAPRMAGSGRSSGYTWKRLDPGAAATFRDVFLITASTPGYPLPVVSQVASLAHEARPRIPRVAFTVPGQYEFRLRLFIRPEGVEDKQDLVWSPFVNFLVREQPGVDLEAVATLVTRSLKSRDGRPGLADRREMLCLALQAGPVDIARVEGLSSAIVAIQLAPTEEQAARAVELYEYFGAAMRERGFDGEGKPLTPEEIDKLRRMVADYRARLWSTDHDDGGPDTFFPLPCDDRLPLLP